MIRPIVLFITILMSFQVFASDTTGIICKDANDLTLFKIEKVSTEQFKIFALRSEGLTELSDQAVCIFDSWDPYNFQCEEKHRDSKKIFKGSQKSGIHNKMDGSFTIQEGIKVEIVEEASNSLQTGIFEIEIWTHRYLSDGEKEVLSVCETTSL